MNNKLFALVGIFFIVILLEPTVVARVEQEHLDERPNYVVIGAFSIHRNAIRFTAHAHKDLKMNAKFEMNPFRKLYYVYVLSTEDQELAINEAKRLRAESEFTDTWVYFGSLGNSATSPGENIQVGQDINPVTEQKIDQVYVSGPERPGDSSNSQLPGQTSSVIPSATEEKMKSLDD